MLYGLNDICIIPATVSKISSRNECNPFNVRGKLPLFTAPMSCIVDEYNIEKFENNGVQTILPRNIKLETRLEFGKNGHWIALSLDEFEKLFVPATSTIQFPISGQTWRVLIDIANGHMEKVLKLCQKAKKSYPDQLIIMAGNIANPATYYEYAKIGIDYVRIGIGSGNVCTTSANGGIHYPMASLINECFAIKQTILKEKISDSDIIKSKVRSIPKIVADGGFKNFDHIIKALALGADYVMLGEIFAKSEEACGEIINQFDDNPIDKKQLVSRYREYYGMSTKHAQQELGINNIEDLKTSEGIIKIVPIEYTLSGWVENFTHYLKSSMSYTNSKTLLDFKYCKKEIMSPQAFNAYYK